MTEHIEAKKDEIAKTVIMPGDPLRAKVIAEKYLEDYKLVNQVRNIYAYTGTYHGKLVTIMASGMGMASIGIYSYELYKFYDVENIIRVGTCGAYVKELKLYDTILVEQSYTDSNFAYNQNGSIETILNSSKELNDRIKKTAEKYQIPLICGTIHSSDIFYRENDSFEQLVEKYHCLGAEMESFALFHTANLFQKHATCLLTVSNSLVDGSTTNSEERQNNFLRMIELALNSIE
jgi:purine nucleoside phosphorylase